MKETTDNNCNYCFRSLNYLGSKLRLLNFIDDQIKLVTPKSAGVCDLFAGSGCVSYKLSSHYPIVSCDVQYYSKVICNALLQRPHISKAFVDELMTRIRLKQESLIFRAFSELIRIENDAIEKCDLEVLASIIEFGSLEVFLKEQHESPISDAQKNAALKLTSFGIPGCESFISRHYGGVYFSYKQSVQIDIILSTIKECIADSEKDIFLAALLSTASDIVDTVGKHFAQPIKTRDAKGKIKSLIYNKAVKDKTLDAVDLFENWLNKYLFLPRSNFKHKIIQCDYIDCLKNLSDDIRTIYADPPYTRDHYSRFYHVLETIALGDEPEISNVKYNGSVRISNGIYRNDRHQSVFCIKSKALAAFETMFRIASTTHKTLLLSYSPYDETKNVHPRVVTMKQLVSLAKNYFPNVEIVSAGNFSHNKLNSSEHFLESSNEAELLIVCKGA